MFTPIVCSAARETILLELTTNQTDHSGIWNASYVKKTAHNIVRGEGNKTRKQKVTSR